VLEALADLTNPTLKSLRIAVAYTTYGGVNSLIPRMTREATQAAWDAAPKTLITTFDMGITDPIALRYLEKEHGFAIRISDVGEAKANYHPKLYVIDRTADSAVLIGSANLSGRALGANTEVMAIYDPYPDIAQLDLIWDAIVGTSHSLTSEELAKYEAERPKRMRPPRPDAPVPAEALPVAADLPVFAQLVEGGVDPMNYDAFWVEAGLVSGGSQSQVELPRLANRFYGSNFDEYEKREVTPITELELHVGPESFQCPLRWHGDNQMERMNLPTPAKSGLVYAGQLVIFRRAPQGFIVDVAPENSAVATSWIEASRQLSTLCRVGRRTNRRCGLLEPNT
jgi:hypothetical protein